MARSFLATSLLAVLLMTAGTSVTANPFNIISLTIFGTPGASEMTGAYGVTAEGDVPASVVSLNTPVFQLKNISESTYELTRFTLTIGDDVRLFDWAAFENSSAGVTFSQASPPLPDNGGTPEDTTLEPSSKTIDYSFTGFDAGNVFEFQADIDPGIQDFRSALMNSAAPAVAKFWFSDGTFVDVSLAKSYQSDERKFSFIAAVEDAVVDIPEPAFVQMGALAALGALGMLRKRSA